MSGNFYCIKHLCGISSTPGNFTIHKEATETTRAISQATRIQGKTQALLIIAI